MNITLPVEILTPRIAKNKQDSLFYSGRNIARFKILNREYVLTTSGEYRFSLGLTASTRQSGTGLKGPFRIGTGDSAGRLVQRYHLTDARIKLLTDDGSLVDNWGWFGINVWEDDKYLSSIATDCYSEYDEAMEAFVEFIKKDLKHA